MRTLRFDHPLLRPTAWVMLVVWLFTFTVGVVNACALTLTGAAERTVAQVPHNEIAAVAGDVRHLVDAQSVVRQGHDEDAGKAGCLKLCDDESSAIAKVKLPVVDLSSILLTLVEPWGAIASPTGAGFRSSPERPQAHGPPLVIRFLRLTL